MNRDRGSSSAEEQVLVRWLPSVLLDLPPEEPITALRTPHRVVLQALPATREGLSALLARHPFELTLEIEDDTAPLHDVPVHDVHEARLAVDLPLDWPQYYWCVDGLLDDLVELAADPAAALIRGRMRLAVAEQLLRAEHRGLACEPADLEAAWACPPAVPAPNVDRHGEPGQALQQYVRGFTAHLAEHATSRPFVEQAHALLQLAEHQPEVALPSFSAPETRALALYLQHRVLGSPCLTAPAGMIAGWHLLTSAYVVGVWWTGLLVQAKRAGRSRDALFTSLWLLDQGLWRDEPLLHDLLRHLIASDYTTPELAAALLAALRGTRVRA